MNESYEKSFENLKGKVMLKLLKILNNSGILKHQIHEDHFKTLKGPKGEEILGLSIQDYEDIFNEPIQFIIKADTTKERSLHILIQEVIKEGKIFQTYLNPINPNEKNDEKVIELELEQIEPFFRKCVAELLNKHKMTA